uniref:Glycosyl transferase family 2 n=1 Tax=Geobacter sp. (strain M21) TaxID=443144 RepID=C6E5V5_GEOSM
MTETDRILAFIPAYRCAAQIPRVLSQFRDPEIYQLFEEILVIDNVSPDNTAQAAIDCAREMGIGKISIVRNKENYGLGGSHKSAFTYAIRNGFTHVLVLHGDDQGDVNDILGVLRAGEHRKYDCCLGARFQKDSQVRGYSKIRIIGNHLYNWLFSVGSGRKIYDLGSGLNLYKTSSLQCYYWLKFHDNLMFNYCMILAHVQRAEKILFFPISWREDDQISNVKLFSQARRTLAILWLYIKDHQKFISRDFRQLPIESYEFETLATNL